METLSIRPFDYVHQDSAKSRAWGRVYGCPARKDGYRRSSSAIGRTPLHTTCFRCGDATLVFSLVCEHFLCLGCVNSVILAGHAALIWKSADIQRAIRLFWDARKGLGEPVSSVILAEC